MYLGIDLGTSAVKVCLMREDGQIAETTSVPLQVRHPFEGASEQNPADWWAATCQAVQQLCAEDRQAVRAIGLSGQMHGAVLLDAARQPIRPAILWNDARAVRACAEILEAEPEAGAVAGVLPMAGFTAPKLLWLAQNETDHHAQIAHILLPKDYIGFRMHGAFVTDPSDAAGTSWLDQSTRTWSPRLCEISATDPAWLPDLRYGSEIAGELLPAAAEALGLPAGLPIAAGAGDAAAGAVGIGAVSAGDGFISLGTSGQLFVTTPAFRPNLDSRIHAYAHTVPGHWFQMAAMLNGARPIAWLAELLGRPIPELLAEARSAEPGPIFLPYLTGERTPHGDSDIRGGFAGLSETATPGVLMRAVLEAVAFTFADAVAALRGAGTECNDLLAIGGGTRDDFLMQTIASVTECRLSRSAGAEVGPALGAARLAAVAESGRQPQEIITKPEVEQVFHPDPAVRDALAPRLAEFRAMYPALQSVQGALKH